MARSSEVVAIARELVGLPFKHQGRSLETGIDCMGVLVLTAVGLGLAPEDSTAYSRRLGFDHALALLVRAGVTREVDGPGEGRIVVFHMPGNLLHGGILTRGGMIHAWWSAHKVIEERSQRWQGRVAQYREYIG